MRRRDAIAALVGTAIACPSIAVAQQSNRLRRVGILMSTADGDPLDVSNLATFVRSLGELGWVAGRNLEIVLRWGAGDVARMEANAQEIVGLAPDVLLVRAGTCQPRGERQRRFRSCLRLSAM